MSSAAALYSAEVLALAVRLADFPMSDDLPLKAGARAPVCGSNVEVGLALDDHGKITRLGLKAHACAIGQASAALFAQSALGKSRSEIAIALSEIEAWLADAEASAPRWPDLSAIAAARSYSARHGAVLLSWKAALAALP